MELTVFFISYMSLWIIACFYAFSLLIRHRESFVIFSKDYYSYLFHPWKLITFFIALSAFVVLAPYTGDPTWDYIDASFMSILTYLTAPWSIATIYLTIKRKVKWYVTYVAVCAWLFSASWSYDIYLVIRDGYYPITWHANLIASSVIYAAAGLFWNLDYAEERGVDFGFMRDDWLNSSSTGNFKKLFWYALPFIIIVAGVFVPFFW